MFPFAKNGFYKIKGYDCKGHRDKALDYEYICLDCMNRIVERVREERRIRMIKLEKDFIGKVCEQCHLLHPSTYKVLDEDNNIIIHIDCVNHDICYNTLSQAASLRSKGE